VSIVFINFTILARKNPRRHSSHNHYGLYLIFSFMSLNHFGSILY